MSDDMQLPNREIIVILYDNLVFSDHNDYQIQCDPALEWERRLADFCSRIPKQHSFTISTVINLLKKHGKPLTQSELLRASRAHPGLELDEGAMKRVCSAAVKENLLTGGTGPKSKGYGLPEWERSQADLATETDRSI